MRIIFIIAFCGMLSAKICQNVTPDLYDAAIAYEQYIKAFESVLPGTADPLSRPDVAKAGEALEIIKSMKAKCENHIDHKDPEATEAKKALALVSENDLILQKSVPVLEVGIEKTKEGEMAALTKKAIEKAREDAITASTKLMALLVEFPTHTPVVITQAAVTIVKPAADSDEDNEDEKDIGIMSMMMMLEMIRMMRKRESLLICSSYTIL